MTDIHYFSRYQFRGWSATGARVDVVGSTLSSTQETHSTLSLSSSIDAGPFITNKGFEKNAAKLAVYVAWSTKTASSTANLSIFDAHDGHMLESSPSGGNVWVGVGE